MLAIEFMSLDTWVPERLQQGHALWHILPPCPLSSVRTKLAHPLSIAANDCGQLGSLRIPALACGSSWRPLSVPFLLSDSLLSHPPPIFLISTEESVRITSMPDLHSILRALTPIPGFQRFPLPNSLSLPDSCRAPWGHRDKCSLWSLNDSGSKPDLGLTSCMSLENRCDFSETLFPPPQFWK